MNNLARALTLAVMVVCVVGVSAQSGPPPSPQVFASANGTFGFKTQPSQPYQLLGMSGGRLFTLAPDGTESVIWRGFLLNVPHRAIVADDGKYVVTLDVWSRIGYERCLVIYDEGGIVVASFDLEALLSKEEITKIGTQTDGSRRWLTGGKVEFNEKNNRVVVTLAWGRVISIELATGVIDAA